MQSKRYRVIDMGTKHSLVEIKHDEGCGENLVEYLNISLRGKDMIGVRVVDPQLTVEVLEKVRSKIGGLSNRGLRSHTQYGESEMRSRCFDVVSDMIKSLQDSSR
mgnify:CR=1 FL=1